MNAVAVMYVNQHLDDLRTEKDRIRMASRVPQKSLREHLASLAASLGILSGNSDPIVPKLENYPYGG